MYFLPGQVRNYATASDVLFDLLPQCESNAAAAAVDVRAAHQQLVHHVEIPREEPIDWQTAKSTSSGG